MSTLLIIGHTFPEPSTTAAGTRMMQLIELFSEMGYKIVFASTATETNRSEDLAVKDVQTVAIRLNDASFDELISGLNPSIVLFDRFVTEEQFGWRVRENCPQAMCILDTEDLHFLRKAREELVLQGDSNERLNLNTETAQREIASIYRCDLSLIISKYEFELLQTRFNIPIGILFYLPLFYKAPTEENRSYLPAFPQRQHFVKMGNFKHAPNKDSVFLLREVWPEIRRHLPGVELHIYGDYADKSVSELNDPQMGFLIMGWTEDISAVLKNARICLAPLRFGAGLKGKILDAMNHGTPIVTTEIGAEGIADNQGFPGRVSDSHDKLIQDAVQLYQDENQWTIAQGKGFQILYHGFAKELFDGDLLMEIEHIRGKLEAHRNRNFVGKILWRETFLSAKFKSKWIELKNSGSSSDS